MIVKKLAMILGAGKGQVPIIDLCHKYNWNVLVVSVKGDYPGFDIAEYCEYIDVRNKEEILNIAKKYEIDAILSDQLDEAVPTMAYISGKMGLCGIPYEVAIKLRDKKIMKQEAEKVGINTAKFCAISNLEEALREVKNLKFPVVVKPADSSASRGVCKVCSIDELAESIQVAKQYSRNGEIIIEEYIQGRYFSVDAFAYNGKITNLDIGYVRDFNSVDQFILKETINVNVLDATCDPIAKKVLDTNKLLFEEFQYSLGIAHAEYVVDETNTVYLIEAAGRGGGGNISSDLVPAATGIQVTDLYVRIMLGMEIDEELIISKNAAGYLFFLLPDGVIKEVEGKEEILQIPEVFKTFLDDIEIGNFTKGIKDKSSRNGPILYTAKTLDECRRCVEKIKKILKVKVLTDKGLVDAIWD